MKPGPNPAWMRGTGLWCDQPQDTGNELSLQESSPQSAVSQRDSGKGLIPPVSPLGSLSAPSPL